jgi:hypothetical protein
MWRGVRSAYWDDPQPLILFLTTGLMPEVSAWLMTRFATHEGVVATWFFGNVVFTVLLYGIGTRQVRRRPDQSISASGAAVLGFLVCVIIWFFLFAEANSGSD